MIKQHALQTTALGPGFCFRSMGVSSKSFQTSGIITAALILFVFCWFCWFRNTPWAFSHAGLKFKVMEIPFWKTLDFFLNFSLFVWMITSKIWEQGVGLQVLSLLSASLGLSYIWAVAAFTVCPHSPLRSAPYFFYSFVFCVQAVRKRALKWKRSHFYARHGLGKNGPQIRTPQVHLVRVHVAGCGEVWEGVQVSAEGMKWSSEFRKLR